MSSDSRGAEIYSITSNKKDEKDQQRRDKEDFELLQLRIEEQRRKLKNFLKLARQMKSTQDEKKIKEFLKYLKEVQKPLPLSKIKELRNLELMGSPYNQSLIAMIKDEQELVKGAKSNDKARKPAKS